MIMGHRLHITPRKDTVTVIHPKGLAQIFAEMGEDISELECREMISAATGGKEPQPQVFVCVWCGFSIFFAYIYEPPKTCRRLPIFVNELELHRNRPCLCSAQIGEQPSGLRS